MDLLQPQRHPNQTLYPGGPPKRPYDIAGWTLPLAMGVRTVEATSAFEAELTPIESGTVPPGRVDGSGKVYLLDPRVNDSFVAVNRLLEGGADVFRSKQSVGTTSDRWPEGTFVVRGASNVASLARELGLTFRAVSRVGGPGFEIKAPRVALYKSFVPSKDEGWSRWLFEQFEFPYKSLHDEEVRKSELGDRYDVVVLPGESSLEKLVQGHEAGTVPPQYAGGMGAEGVENLRKFVQGGGTLVCLDSATELPIEYFDIPVESALANVEESQFFCPGSLLEIELDPAHPIAYGMNKTGVAFFKNSHTYNLIPDFESKNGQVAAKYPDRNPLLSGWILGDELLRRKAAVVDMPYGEGRVILIGFRSQFRGQTHGTFKLLFNALYYGSATPAKLP